MTGTTKIILNRQSDLILTSPSITSPIGIVAADITDSTLGQTLQTTIDGLAQATTSSLSAEISRATSAEGSIASDLSAEISRATDAEGSIASDLSAEISRATDAETSLASSIGYIVENFDKNQIDSLKEALNTYSQVVSYNGQVNGNNTDFELVYYIDNGTELVYLNGLLQAPNKDYTVTTTASGKISMLIFTDKPRSGDSLIIVGRTNTDSNLYDPNAGATGGGAAGGGA